MHRLTPIFWATFTGLASAQIDSGGGKSAVGTMTNHSSIGASFASATYQMGPIKNHSGLIEVLYATGVPTDPDANANGLPDDWEQEFFQGQTVDPDADQDFGVAYSTSLRRVTVNYYNGAPAASRTITATYRYGTSGITGALSSGAEHWMAVSVDGTVQGSRQRVLAVPFALRAEASKQLAPEFKFGNYDSRQPDTTYQAEQSGFVIASYPGGGGTSSVRQVLVGDAPNNLMGITPTNAGNSMSGVQHCVPVSKGRFWHAQGFTEVKFVAISQ